MRFAPTDDQRAFADGLGDLLTGECPPSVVRASWEDGTGHAPALWRALGDLGLFGLLAPEPAGGMGAGMVDAVLLFERLGVAAVPGPVIEQMVGAALLADAAETGDARPDGIDIAAVVDGTVVVTLAETPVTDDATVAVPHAAVADVVVTPDGTWSDVEATAVGSLDGGRLLATVTGGTTTSVGIDAAGWDLARERMALATAAQQTGLAAAMVNLAAEYARQRNQFGRPIGAFQAVKHHLADALGAVDFARAPIVQAAWSLDEGLPSAPADVSAARVLANESARLAARHALQVHGAIGYTWECDLHLWMKKAWALQSAWGDTSSHRRRVTRWLVDRDAPVTDDGVTIPSFDRLR